MPLYRDLTDSAETVDKIIGSPIGGQDIWDISLVQVVMVSELLRVFVYWLYGDLNFCFKITFWWDLFQINSIFLVDKSAILSGFIQTKIWPDVFSLDMNLDNMNREKKNIYLGLLFELNDSLDRICVVGMCHSSSKIWSQLLKLSMRLINAINSSWN